jgi:hypothetical protein
MVERESPRRRDGLSSSFPLLLLYESRGGGAKTLTEPEVAANGEWRAGAIPANC